MAVIPWFEPFYVGRGIDIATGQVFTDQAVEFDPEQPESSGQRTTLRLISIASSRELTDNLAFDASASYLGSGWGVSGEFELVKNRQMNNYYTYALVKVMVTNPPTIVRNVRLKPDALNFFQNNGWDAFVKRYGTEYIEGRKQGGIYYALIEVQTTNQKEQINTKSKLSGFYGTFKADAKLTTTFQEIVNTTVVNVFVLQIGGAGSSQNIGLQEVVDRALSFPATVLSKPENVSALTARYDGLLPTADPNALARRSQRDTLQDLNIAYLNLRDQKSNLEFILNPQHFYKFDEHQGLSEQELAQRRATYQLTLDQIKQELDSVVQQASRCSNDFNQCQAYAQKTPSVVLPVIGGQLMDIKQIEERLATLQQDVLRQQLPVGTILPWYSRAGGMPAGWAVCDGGNGTPDLRNRFIMGTSDPSAVGQAGGGRAGFGPVNTRAYAAGWNDNMSQSPNGGPEANAGWRSQQWHQLVSDVQIPYQEFDVTPAFCRMLYIMKLS